MPVSGDLHIGDSLLGYEIEALIGRGGMGVVYRARDRALDRKVALKLIAPELAAFTGFRARFLAESRLAASLEHPNVVPIYAAGEQDDLLYIAMRYVEGSDLKRILMDGPLPPDRTIAICSQVASALDAAHELGLVHRDVKPSNVLVDPHDHAFLVDFGLTRLVSDIGQVPVATSSLGTIEYIAPEQIRGDRIDGRTDVYSLGCVLHECITGEPPFPHASEVALLFAHLEEEPPATSSLGDVLAKALAKDPDDRYATCGELVDAAATALGVAHQRKRRWPVIAAVLAAAVIALSAGIAVMTRGAEGATTGRLFQINPATHQVTRAIPIGDRPTGVAVGGGKVWTTAFDGTSRVDPSNGRITKIGDYAGPIGIAATRTTAYAVDGNHLIIIGAATGIPKPYVDTTKAVGDLELIAEGRSGVWGATTDSVYHVQSVGTALSTVNRVGVIPGREDEEHVRADVTGMAIGAGNVWVVGDVRDPRLWRMSIPGNAPTEMRREVTLPTSPGGVAYGYGALWVTGQISNRLYQIDPRTLRTIRTITVGREPMGVAVGAGAVWVTNAIDGTVSEINPDTGRTVATIPVGGSPTSVAVGAGSVWVAGGSR